MIKLDGKVNENGVKFLIDTGASHNFISFGEAKEAGLDIQLNDQPEVTLGDGTTVSCFGEIKGVPIKIGDKFEDCVNFKVLPGKSETVILGIEFLNKHKPIIDWSKKGLKINDQMLEPQGERSKIANNKLVLATASEV